MPDTCDVVVLLSGTGSNLQALIDSDDVKASPANIRAVISNRADAGQTQHQGLQGFLRGLDTLIW